MQLQLRYYTLPEALCIVPALRMHLVLLRAGYIAAKMHGRRDPARGREAAGTARLALQALTDLGVVVFDKPYRGIALIPTDPRPNGPARFLVYHDTRDGIDDYVICDEMKDSTDLDRFRRPLKADTRP